MKCDNYDRCGNSFLKRDAGLIGEVRLFYTPPGSTISRAEVNKVRLCATCTPEVLRDYAEANLDREETR